jgi:hypothetical protein
MIKPVPGPLSETNQPGATRRLSTEERYRRLQVFGLLLLACIILAVTLLRADPHTLFPPGWWRF